MEATSPKWRVVATFQYGAGWGMGMLAVPLLNGLVRDYRLFLAILLACQLAMLPWLRWGLFESIRWLLSEGLTGRAQIELRRACCMNRVHTSPKLAKSIAQIQVQQVRRASRLLDEELASARLAQALECKVVTATQELDMLSAAIKRSFGLDDAELGAPADDKGPPPLAYGRRQTLSPTLARRSFSIGAELGATNQPERRQQEAGAEPQAHKSRHSVTISMGSSQSKNSLTTQALVQLAMQYSKVVEQQQDGACFLIRMFNRKLWKETVILTLLSLMLETAYYGLLQANNFVGTNVDLNYITGAVGEWAAAIVSTVFMLALSRRAALIVPTLVSSLACFGMALAYQLMPDDSSQGLDANSNSYSKPNSSLGPPHQDNIGILLYDQLDVASDAGLQVAAGDLLTADRVQLRHLINLYLMNIGRFSVSVTVEVVSTIAIELYPSNLRQTAPGAIVFVGRVGSIVAPFLFNDPTEDKWVFKSTLVALSAIGILACLLVPFTLRDNKDKELCDHMDEIESVS